MHPLLHRQLVGTPAHTACCGRLVSHYGMVVRQVQRTSRPVLDTCVGSLSLTVPATRYRCWCSGGLPPVLGMCGRMSPTFAIVYEPVIEVGVSLPVVSARCPTGVVVVLT